MRVSIKNFKVSMGVKRGGVEFTVYDNSDNFLGDLYVTMTGLIWCRGRTTRANGVNKSWEDFIAYMQG